MSIKNLLRHILRKLAQLTIWRYRPGVIGVTGTVGKTSTKLAIKAVLGNGRRVRASFSNLNNDLGLPLAILGNWPESDLKLVSRATPPGTEKIKKTLFWLRVIFGSAWRIIVKARDYPEILVLEYGADRPGDIKYLLKIARPNISIITAVGDVPVHVEFYDGPAEVAREKGRLIEYLPVAGFAILNYDDETVMGLSQRTRARVMTYGFEKGAEIKISRLENRMEGNRPIGISFKLEYKGSFVPVRLNNVFGRSHAYAAAAAAVVGIVFGMNLVAISEALADYAPADSRMQVLPGIKNTFIVDDSYNASPLSMRAALDAMRDLSAKRKVAVLGDMLELGPKGKSLHRGLAMPIAANAIDLVFCCGPLMQSLWQALPAGRRGGYAVDSAALEAQVVPAIRAGDAVMVKGSLGSRMAPIVKALQRVYPVEEASAQG